MTNGTAESKNTFDIVCIVMMTTSVTSCCGSLDAPLLSSVYTYASPHIEVVSPPD